MNKEKITKRSEKKLKIKKKMSKKSRKCFHESEPHPRILHINGVCWNGRHFYVLPPISFSN